MGKIISIVMSSSFGTGGAKFRTKISKGSYVDTLAFGAYRRNVFKILGGYDEELIRNQDDEFHLRMNQRSMKIWLDPSIKSKYFSRPNLAGLIKQYFYYGFYKIRVFQKRRGIASLRHIVPLLFSLYILLLLLYMFFSNPPNILLFAPLFYFSISFLYSFFYSVKEKVSIILLMMTYFIMHFSYGICTLIGMIKYFRFWNDNVSIQTHFKMDQ